VASVAQVEDVSGSVLAKVRKAKASAEPGITSLFYSFASGTDADGMIYASMTTLETKALAWQKRGLAHARAKTQPAGGWAGWVAQGQNWVDGATSQLEETRWFLPAIIETVKAAPSHAAGDLKRGGEIAGAGVSSLAGGFLKEAWWVVLVVGAGAVGYLYLQSKVLKG